MSTPKTNAPNQLALHKRLGLADRLGSTWVAIGIILVALCLILQADISFGEWTVTVTAPSGTVHEAFFDPVDIGDAVGADGTNGVLKPAAFALDGVTTTIQSLKWQNGTVTMKLNPPAPFTGYAIDFISLDDSVSLTLSFDDDGSARTLTGLTWSVANQPWDAGDKLMLRVRRS